MGAVDWIELIKTVANVIAIPAIGFIWRTLARIDRIEAKVDLLMQVNGLKNPADKSAQKEITQ